MKKIRQHLQLLLFYTRAKLEAESFRHFAGYVWWVLDPLIGVGIYYLLFKIIRPSTTLEFIPFLLVGLITWKWINDSINKSAVSIQGSLEILKKLKLDSHIFPVTETLYNTSKFISIFALVVIGYCFLYGISYSHLFIVPMLLSSFIFILGSAVAISSVVPLFPDLQFFINYSFRLLFYPSGVLFSLERIPPEYRAILKYNPIANLIQGFREILIDLTIPGFFMIFYPLTIGISLLLLGLYLTRRYNQEYPKLY